MNRWLFVGAVNGFLAVAAGAFAAHGLQAMVSERELAVFRTGADYHLIHALAIVAAGLAARETGAARAGWAACLFTAGIVLFSGSLYVLALTGADAANGFATSSGLVFLTPLGGLCLLAGWVMLAFAAFKSG